jgi:ABC-2 type transport system permease protein
MSWRRSSAVIRNDLRILRSDPAFLIALIAMPLIVMGFIKPAFQSALILAGNPDANGAEQVVPGTSVLFALFLVGNLGFGVFREHGWNTWERLRASPASTADLMAGKAVTPMVALLVQQTVLIGLGGLIFDLHVNGSALGMALVAVAFGLSLIGLGFLLLAITRTVMQLNAITNIGTMVLGGLGGAITPISSLPDWARHLAPAVPSYWAMRGYQTVILDGGGVSDVLGSVGALLAFAIGFGLVAALRFRAEETKLSWA